MHMSRLLACLKPTNDERTVIEACEKLGALARQHPDQIRTLMMNSQGGGVIPLMEMLEVCL